MGEGLGQDADSPGMGQTVWTRLPPLCLLHPSLLGWEQGSPGHWDPARWDLSLLPGTTCRVRGQDLS